MRLFLRSGDRRPDPPPLPTNDRLTVTVGIACWAVLWIIAGLLHDRLVESGRGWWLWTPPAAIALGLLGLGYLHRRARRSPQ